jgi:hypothetical protein
MWHLTDPHADGTSVPGDSAGQPWAGRHFDANHYSGDAGQAPERLIEALRRFRSSEVGQADVIDAVRDARLLVPLVAHAGETGVDEHGRLHDKTQELSLVTVTAPDGRKVQPAFTSTETMAAWNPKARPIPADARRVALAAAGEGTPLLVLDPTSETEFAFRASALRAVAEGTPWLAPGDDDVLAAAFLAGLEGETLVRRMRLEAGDPTARLVGPEVIVVLGLAPGLGQGELNALVQRAQARWQSSALIAERVDSLGVRLVPA